MKHESNPVTGEYTLCGIAWDCNHLDMCSGEPDVDFVKAGEKVDCPDCCKVIAYCKAITKWVKP